MARKTISLSEDVYRKLAEEKRESESFGDVIDRLLGGRSFLSSFWGAWSAETGAAAMTAVEEARMRGEEKLDRLDN